MEPKSAEKKIISFIRERFAEAGRKVAVVGLSGGLDSAATLSLCCRALGPGRVVAAILPTQSTPPQDVHDAALLARELRVKSEKFEIGCIVDSFGEYAIERLERANISARVRMAILYSLAARYNGLVVGTGDKSEYLLGYFTKHGDGGADLFPILSLYKTEVKRLAAHLGIPKSIIDKPPSPALWTGHTAEAELGFSYEIADRVLAEFEKGKSKAALGKKFDRKIVSAILRRIGKNLHKRKAAPVCKL